MQIQHVSYLSDHPATQSAHIKMAWLYTTRSYPLYWHHIAKNGGSYFKNFLYVLDHGEKRTGSSSTHDWDDELARVEEGAEEAVRRSAYSLIIMRNPIHRFLSVYFDKVYTGGGDLRPGMSRAFFEENEINQSPDLNAAGHTENCLKLAEWAAMNIRCQTLAKPNWHLVPQMHQLAQAYDLNFRVLTLEDFGWQLEQALSGLVPDIKAKMALTGKANVSKKPVRKSEIVTPELRQMLKDIYQDDFAVFREVRQYWRDLKEQSVQ